MPSFKLNFFQKTSVSILKQGKVPNHVAFIMDGNRRYAKNHGEEAWKGHQYGVTAVERCLVICDQIGVKQISLYTFSLQNFNRSAKEVEVLMTLLLKNLKQGSQVHKVIKDRDVKVRVIGQVDKFKQDVQQSLLKIVQETKEHNRLVLNICCGYDSFFEVEQALNKSTANPTYQNFFQNLEINTKVDLMVRTSNEWRLSNYLLPQSKNCKVVILKQNWPQINLWSFFKIILSYNYSISLDHNQQQKTIAAQ